MDFRRDFESGFRLGGEKIASSADEFERRVSLTIARIQKLVWGRRKGLIAETELEVGGPEEVVGGDLLEDEQVLGLAGQ